MAKKPIAIVIKLHGKPFDHNPPSDNVIKIMKYLESCPKDEVFHHTDISKKLSLGAEYVRTKAAGLKVFEPYTALVSGKRYVGNPAAISELLRQVGDK